MEIASSAFRNEARAPIVCEHSTLFLSVLALGPIQDILPSNNQKDRTLTTLKSSGSASPG